MAAKRIKKEKTTDEMQDEAASLLERTLPQNLDMERGLLGSVLINPNVLDDVLPILHDSDFYVEANQIIYRHLAELYSSAKQVDSKILLEDLIRTSDLERVGGINYIVELVHEVAIADHAFAYAEIIRDKARLRQLIHASSAIIQEAYDPAVDVNALVSQAEEKIFAVHDERSNDSLTDIYHALTEVWEKIDMLAEGGESGLKTGYTDFDSKTGGLHDSELIILAARPSMGKTALAANIADAIAVDQQKGVLFVSLEMSRTELVLRMLCGRASVDSQRVKQGHISTQETKQLQSASSMMMNAPFHIDDTPNRTVSEIAAIARRLKRQGQLSLIVIDYLQLIQPDNDRDARQEQVAKIARRLKGLAREMQCPVICLSQLNRQTENTGNDHRPKLSQLRESGAIEQDADVVMFVHREAYYASKEKKGKDKDAEKEEENKGKDKQTDANENLAEIIIAKQRNGPTGTINLTWIPSLTKFVNYYPNSGASTGLEGYD